MRPAQVTPPAPAFGGPAAPQVLFLALRDMVLIGGLLLVLFGTTAPAHRPHLPTLALVLAAYKGGMYVWFWSGRGRRARLVFGLTADILFLNALVHTTGGVGSHMDLLLFVLIALYAAQFGRAAGLWAAAIATSGYALAVGVDGVPADRWAAVGTRAALFWLQGGTVGWLAQRERRARACAEQLNAELHDTLARLERTQADLVRAEKLAAIGQMASKMAHEIRNPLGAMALNLGLLEERLGGRLDDVRDMVGALRDQIGALTGLSEDYLRLGRLPRPRPEPLDVSHLVASLGELLRGELAARGITLRTSVPPDLPPLSADPGLLRQATFNLLKNALEAVAPGGTVGIEARAEAGTFRLTVWDDGPGIGPEADRIFEPFYTTKVNGNGLGLAVARQIVRDHGGELTCEAGRGRGPASPCAFPSSSRRRWMEDQVREAASVLVVDDHPAMRDALVRSVAINGTEVLAAADGTEALAILRERPVAVVVTDLKMPGVDGLGLLKAVKLLRPDSEVVLVTAHGQVADAVQAIKDGAYDFITKPFEPFAIRKLVARALERHALRAVNRSLAAELATLRGPGQIVGSSQAMRRVLEMVRQVAPSTSTILIQGESGTGKELIADAIHQLSPRREDPFIKVNCAALPDTLLESELFGYERGAFTGAVARKEGRFELAHGGTLFLDEVADMAPATQAKLLRALQEGTFERLGGTKTITVDVRVVAATNRDLRRAMEEGTFREDLFYRLNVIAILLPPLRDRGEDLPLLAQHFLSLFSSKNGKQITAFTPEAMAVMVRYRWPGNVRELENAIERAVVLDRDGVLGVEDLPDAVRGGPGNGARSALTFPIGTPLEEMERRVIAETLDHCKNDKTLAARLLGISSRTIYRKIEEQGASK